MAACSIANIVKTSLGPVGLDKMMVDDVGVSFKLKIFRSFIFSMFCFSKQSIFSVFNKKFNMNNYTNNLLFQNLKCVIVYYSFQKYTTGRDDHK